MSDTDLYEILEISQSATKTEIKKAYHKAALQHHPDKVSEDRRAEADVKFKAVSQAYEILSDDNKRHLYDTHGMAAFDGSRGPGGMGVGPDIQDMFEEMFGGGMGGMPFGMGGMGGMGGGRGGPRRPRRSPDEKQTYEVKLEELYKGKTVKFASTKNVICTLCNGGGGKDKAKPKTCDRCDGQGVKIALRSVGGGMMMQEQIECPSCTGSGKVFKDKDKCKKCKGKCTVSEKKGLELYIPRGAMQGEKIVLEGEADQVPGQEPGDIVFTIEEEDHETFERRGNDLLAECKVTLGESLCGFSRVVLTHLDGRGIRITHEQGKILRPGQILKVPGEGMPIKKSDAKGDLYLNVEVIFPEDGSLIGDDVFSKLTALLPKPEATIAATDIEDVDYDRDADIEDFGAKSGAGGAEWEDEDDEEEEGTNAQCAQQ